VGSWIRTVDPTLLWYFSARPGVITASSARAGSNTRPENTTGFSTVRMVSASPGGKDRSSDGMPIEEMV
jgi:hypothetical protein